MLDYAILKLQPDIASGMGINDSSIIKKAIEFYKQISGKDLSESQVKNMFQSKGPNGKDIEVKLKNTD